jgi:hypothetical protein
MWIGACISITSINSINYQNDYAEALQVRVSP